MSWTKKELEEMMREAEPLTPGPATVAFDPDNEAQCRLINFASNQYFLALEYGRCLDDIEALKRRVVCLEGLLRSSWQALGCSGEYDCDCLSCLIREEVGLSERIVPKG